MKVKTLKDITFKRLMRDVFTAIKNSRRRAILDDLCNYEGLTLEQLARKLRKRGYYHSRSTILEYYVTPLIRGRLIKQIRQNLFRISGLGEKVQRELKPIEEYSELLNPGNCYEEFFLVALSMASGQLSYGQLTEIVPMHTISRIEQRIAPLIKKDSARTYYFVTEAGVETNGNLPNDIPASAREIFHLIKGNGGLSASELFELSPLRPRTCYKHLKRLKEHGLIRSQKQTVSFDLTPTGRKLAEALHRIGEHLFFELKKQVPKALIIDYLGKQVRQVAANELVEQVLDHYFQEQFGRVTNLAEFEQLIRELKLANLIEGNRHQGYKLPQDLKLEMHDFPLYVKSTSTSR